MATPCSTKPNIPSVLVEPFAGGGSIALTATAEVLVDQVVMVELDDAVAAVWEVVIHGNAEALARRIEQFEVSMESVQQELDVATKMGTSAASARAGTATRDLPVAIPAQPGTISDENPACMTTATSTRRC